MMVETHLTGGKPPMNQVASWMPLAGREGDVHAVVEEPRERGITATERDILLSLAGQ